MMTSVNHAVSNGLSRPRVHFASVQVMQDISLPGQESSHTDELFARKRKADLETIKLKRDRFELNADLTPAELLATPIGYVDKQPVLVWDLLKYFEEHLHDKKRFTLFGNTIGLILGKLFVRGEEFDKAWSAFQHLKTSGLIKACDYGVLGKLNVTHEGFNAILAGRPKTVYDPVSNTWTA